MYNWDASSLPDEASRFVLLAWRRPRQPHGTATSSHQRQTAFGFRLGGAPGGYIQLELPPEGGTMSGVSTEKDCQLLPQAGAAFSRGSPHTAGT